jgi:hypothetical protein
MSHKQRARLNLAHIATRLADQEAFWRPLVDYDPVSRYYVRLAAERDFEAWLLTWLPSQGTDWHDHGGSAGAFVTLQGRLTELQAQVQPGGHPVINQLPRTLSAGALRPFGRKHIHKVTNDALEPAVSLHVYGPALVEMNQYEPSGNMLELVSSRLVGVNW